MRERIWETIGILLLLQLVPSPSARASCPVAFGRSTMDLRGGGEFFRGAESSGMELDEEVRRAREG